MTKKQFNKLFSFVQGYMNLGWWNISISFIDLGNNEAGKIDMDYMYFQANISIDNEVLTYSIKEATTVIIHELSHIYTSTGRWYFRNEIKPSVVIDLGENRCITLGNAMGVIEENYTVHMERLIKGFIHKDMKYKKLVKELV